MKSEQTLIEMPDFLPRSLQMDGPFLWLLDEYSGGKNLLLKFAANLLPFILVRRGVRYRAVYISRYEL